VNILRHPATIVVLILLVVLLFGSKRLPDMAKSVGQSLKIFKKEVKELREDVDVPLDGTPAAPAPTAAAPVQNTTSTGTGTVPSAQDDATPRV
jgi:sec-independent protein translocase protein TatA